MGNNLIHVVEYQYAEDFFQDLSYGGNLYQLKNSSFVFRGHSHSYYRLVPTALREDITHCSRYATKITKEELPEEIQVLNEAYILRDFFKVCDYNGLVVPNVNRLRNTIFSFFDIKTIFEREMWLPEDLYEVAALAQHYGLPTRLLDWTYDINTSIYFALSGYLNDQNCTCLKPDNLVIWALDTRVCTNTAIFQMPLGNQQLDNQIGNLFNIRFPLKVIRPQYSGNPNLCAQKGVFTFWESQKANAVDGTNDPIDRRSLDELLKEFITNHDTLKPFIHFPLLYKISLPNREIKKLYGYIRSNHIDASTLFPGYTGAVKSIMDDIRIKNIIIPE